MVSASQHGQKKIIVRVPFQSLTIIFSDRDSYCGVCFATRSGKKNNCLGTHSLIGVVSNTVREKIIVCNYFFFLRTLLFLFSSETVAVATEPKEPSVKL